MPKVKICGITNQADMLMCDSLGTDLLGFILIRESPRFLPDLNIIGVKTNAQKVAVVRNPLPKDIEHITEFDLIQFHGFEPPDVVLRAKESGLKIIKTIFPDNKDSIKLCEKLSKIIDFFLVDSSSKIHGVKSSPFPTKNLEEIIDNGKIFGRDFFLSGGLTSENVKEFIEKYNPYGVDAASGVEEYPGKKSYKKVEEFIKASKNKN